MAEQTDDRDPATRVRQLLLSGDNIIKNRDNPERYARARERYVKARVLADEANLDASVLSIIDLRLTGLPDPAEGAL
jgi:hypothetical protein